MPRVDVRGIPSNQCAEIVMCSIVHRVWLHTKKKLTDGGGDAGGEHVVDVADQRVELRDELDQSLRKHNHTVVLAPVRTLEDHLHQLVHNLRSQQQKMGGGGVDGLPHRKRSRRPSLWRVLPSTSGEKTKERNTLGGEVIPSISLNRPTQRSVLIINPTHTHTHNEVNASYTVRDKEWQEEQALTTKSTREKQTTAASYHTIRTAVN